MSGPTERDANAGSARVARVPRTSIARVLASLVAACVVPALFASAALVYVGHRLDVDVSQDALVAMRHAIPLFVVAALSSLALALWFATRVARAVIGAVESLIDPVRALGSGRAVESPETPLRETDAVGRAIEQASRLLTTAHYHAYHDPLTGLRNRALFDEMALRQIAQAYRDGAQLALLALDLDGFKAVNDLHGHAAGDLVLKHVADRITGLIRASDVVTRRGGDEFSVMLVDVDGARTRQVAEKLLTALSRSYPDVEPAVSASIGVARYPHDATTLRELLQRADEALYEAKNAGRNRVAGDL